MRNEARKYFLESGLAFDDIRREHIDTLREIIQTHLDRRNEKLSDTKMAVNKRMRKPDFAGGKLKQCEITMRCHYFNSREAITFDRSGFIGFAGWADDTNVKPLTDAFIEWVDQVKQLKGKVAI